MEMKRKGCREKEGGGGLGAPGFKGRVLSVAGHQKNARKAIVDEYCDLQ
jgi:hypothetical protein